MTLQDCALIVIAENDNEYHSIKERVVNEYNPGSVWCVHAPIGPNILVTVNGLYDVLTNSKLEYVVIVRNSELDKTYIGAGIKKYNQEHLTSQKPLLQKLSDPLGFEWCSRYNLVASVVVAARNDLFDALKQQSSQVQTTFQKEQNNVHQETHHI